MIPSPCYVLDEKLLRRNLELLRHVAEASGATVICALKGYAVPATFPLVRRFLPGVTASSLAEARLGRDVFGGVVHAYCPAYVPTDFDEIVAASTHVTFNSLGEWKRYRGRLAGASAGLRINPEYAEVETDLYNPCVPGSRLGLTAAALGGALPDGIAGLHSHTLCEKGADTLERTLERIEAAFDRPLRQARWLNLGGGHAITRAGYEVDRLIELIRDLRRRRPNLEEVVLEPGSAVGWETGWLESTVLDVVDNGGVKTAMLDTSFANHMPDTLEMPYRPRVRGARDATAADREGRGDRVYHLGGQTCLAGDFMPDYVFEAPLAVGDRVIFEDMIHYTMVKTTTFNGVRLPAIGILREAGGFELVKSFDDAEYRARI